MREIPILITATYTKGNIVGIMIKGENRLRSSFCMCIWRSLPPTTLAETHPTLSQRTLLSSCFLHQHISFLTSHWSASWVVSSCFLSLVRTIILAPVYCSFGTETFSLPPCWCYRLFCYSSSPSGDICSWTFTSYLISLFLSAILIPQGIKILPQIVHSLILYFQLFLHMLFYPLPCSYSRFCFQCILFFCSSISSLLLYFVLYRYFLLYLFNFFVICFTIFFYYFLIGFSGDYS